MKMDAKNGLYAFAARTRRATSRRVALIPRQLRRFTNTSTEDARRVLPVDDTSRAIQRAARRHEEAATPAAELIPAAKIAYRLSHAVFWREYRHKIFSLFGHTRHVTIATAKMLHASYRSCRFCRAATGRARGDVSRCRQRADNIYDERYRSRAALSDRFATRSHYLRLRRCATPRRNMRASPRAVAAHGRQYDAMPLI